MTKLVKTDSAVESASREFSARLTKMLGAPEASNGKKIMSVQMKAYEDA